MKAADIARTCIRNLTKRKVRTLLTVSGVVIGTSAVIVMVSLGVGMNRQMTKMLEEWADLTMIQVYNYQGMTNENGETIPDITDEVIGEFNGIEHVKAVLPISNTFYVGNSVAIYNTDGKALQYCPFVGTYMDELENFGYVLKEGRFKQAGDPVTTVLFGSQACEYVLLYEDTSYNSFENAEYDYNTGEIISMPADPMKDEFHIIPLGRDPVTWQLDYSVIGSKTAPNMEYDEVLNVVGVIDGDWSDYNSIRGIFIDIAYIADLIEAYNEFNPDYPMEEFNGVYNDVRVRVDDMKNVESVEKELKAMGYQTSSFNQQREQMMKQVVTIQLLLAALASVSLFVAAMNITNTMIMAIVERTKEIGIMKVLGCDIGKIRLLFLGEAAAIGFLGGVAGTALSYGLSFLINNFLGGKLLNMFGGYYDTGEKIAISSIPLWLVLAALGGATMIGMIAGFYPANRSVKISALSAISHE